MLKININLKHAAQHKGELKLIKININLKDAAQDKREFMLKIPLVLLLLVDIIEYLWVHWGAFVFSYFHVLVLVEFCWDILCSHFRGILGITRDNLRNPQRFC